MEKILFISHVDDQGKLPGPGSETLAGAMQLAKDMTDGSFSTALFGLSTEDAARQAGAAGCSEIFVVESDELKTPRYATDVAAITALVKRAQPDIVLAPNTSRIARVLAGAARRCGGSIDTRVNGLKVEGETLSLVRWFYRQRMEGHLSRKSRPWFISMDSGIYPAFSGDPADVSPVRVDVNWNDISTNIQTVGLEKLSSDAQTIKPDASLLFVAGAGWTKKQGDGSVHLDEAESLIKGFLAGSGASLGSSKSLVDQSSEGQKVLDFMSHLNQVGQTGASPRHPKGLATCCHGEEPHVVGWRFINERRAVNTDANCGWARGKTDVLYVADAFAVMKRVNELLQS